MVQPPPPHQSAPTADLTNGLTSPLPTQGWHAEGLQNRFLRPTESLCDAVARMQLHSISVQSSAQPRFWGFRGYSEILGSARFARLEEQEDHHCGPAIV